jgi:hypothetical protein
MNNTTVIWRRLRTALFRLALAFGLVFSLIFTCGLSTNHVLARTGQPQEPREEIKPKPKPEPPDGTDPAKNAAINKKAKEDFDPKKPDAAAKGKNPPGASPAARVDLDRKKTSKGLNIRPLDGPTLPYNFWAARFDSQFELTEGLDPDGHVAFGGINQIQIPRGLLQQGLRLGPFHEINERFLSDVASLELADSLLWKNFVGPYRKKQFANTSVVTAARLEDGTEVLTVFDMPDSFEKGRLVGRVELLPRDTDNTKQVRRIVGERGQGGRVFFYGGDLHDIDLTTIAAEAGVELIRRTNDTRELLSLQQRLNTIASRHFDRQHTVVVNGLPASREAVARMGLFAGRVETWLDFRESINSITPPDVTTTSERDDFFRHLQQGDSDLLVLVAHSDGLYVYLGDSRISLKEISALPDRQERSIRPRLAVIVSCNAGKEDSPSVWRRILGRDFAPLGQLLVKKGFVDKVIAPDHVIHADEARETFSRALSGVTQSIFKGWNEWAVRFHPLLGMAS